MRGSTLALLLLVACGDPEGALPAPIAGAGREDPVRGGELHLALTTGIRSLDPAMSADVSSVFAQHLLFDTLVGYAPATSPDSLSLVPQLAASWDVTPDGLVYRFHLREAARFEDGTPIRAEHFVYALERVRDPKTASPGAGYYAGIREARAPGPLLFEIELTAPDASFPLLLAMKYAAPLRPDHVTGVGDELRRRPLASGPFRLASWDEGNRIVFARNETYWDAASIYLDSIVVRLQVPPSTGTLLFLRGEVDFLEDVGSDDYLRLASSPSWRQLVRRSPRIESCAEQMNTSRPPFHDRRVRRAFNYAIRKEDTVVLRNGRAVVARGFLPPSLPGADPARAPYPHDPERARRLLAEAGHGGGLAVTYTTLDDALNVKIAQSIQADLAEVGVDVTIQVLTFSAYVGALMRGELEFSFVGWFMDFPDAWNFLETSFHSRMIHPEHGLNVSRYRHPEVDRLLDEARRELDGGRRADLYRRAEQIIFDDAPFVFHYHPLDVQVWQPYVRGYAQHPVWSRDVRRVWLDR